MSESKDRAALRAIQHRAQAVQLGAPSYALSSAVAAMAANALNRPDPAEQLAQALRFYADGHRDAGATARAALAAYEAAK